MKTRSIPVITKWWLALWMVLAVLTCVGMAGADPTLDEQLIKAAARGDAPLVKSLLDKGADINATDNDGRSALMIAAHEGHLAIVSLLLDRGANVNARNKGGWTALTAAARRGSPEVVQILLERGADFDAGNKLGVTPLMMASHFGHIQVVRVLLDKGADVTAKSSWGITALNMASNKGHTQIVELLGANESTAVKRKMIEGTVKLIVLLGILGLIAQVGHDRPLDQPFFENQKWTLNDAYRIMIPLLAFVYLQFILNHTLTQYASFLSLICGSIYCIAIYGCYYLFVKNAYGVSLTIFGLDKANFLKSGVFHANVALILTLFFIIFGPRSPEPSFGISDININPMVLVSLIPLFLIVLVVPLLEELLFRGIMYTPVARRIGAWKAVGLLSVVGGLWHLHHTDVETLRYILFFVLLYCIYIRSTSLYGGCRDFVSVMVEVKTDR